MLKRVRRLINRMRLIEVSFRRRMRSRYYGYTQILLQPPTTCAHLSRAGRPPSHRFKFALRRNETIVIESDQLVSHFKTNLSSV